MIVHRIICVNELIGKKQGHLKSFISYTGHPRNIFNYLLSGKFCMNFCCLLSFFKIYFHNQHI